RRRRQWLAHLRAALQPGGAGHHRGGGGGRPGPSGAGPGLAGADLPGSADLSALPVARVLRLGADPGAAPGAGQVAHPDSGRGALAAAGVAGAPVRGAARAPAAPESPRRRRSARGPLRPGYSPVPSRPVRGRCQARLASFSPTICTSLPFWSYFSSIASSAATVEES